MIFLSSSNVAAPHQPSFFNNNMSDNEKINSNVNLSQANTDDLEGTILDAVISVNGREYHLDANNVDQAMEAAIEAKGMVLTPEQDKKLLRKIDLYLLPFITFLYAVQYMDKITNSFASIMGMREELGMSGSLYSWLGSAFYLGYLVTELPASYLLQKFPMAKVTSIFIVFWGICTCLAPATNSAGFVALRVILGGFESAVTPAMVIINTQWYKKEEHFMRTAIWLGACNVGGIMGYAFAYGLYANGGDWSIPSWKVVYIVIGLCNLVLAAAFFFHIPDTPLGAWFLSDEEKLMAVERIRANNQGFGNRKFKKDQLIECLTDYKIWLMFAFVVIDEVPNGGVTNFSSIMLKSFNFSTKASLRLNIGLSGCGMVFTCAVAALHSLGWVKSRIFCSVFAIAVALAGSSMLAFGESKVALAGLFIMSVSDIGFICLISLFQSNVAGYTKKMVGNAIFLIGYCAGNVIGPQTFKSSEAPNYHTAKGCIVGCYSACIVLIIALFFAYYFENKKRDAEKAALGDKYEVIENIEFADLTDKQNPDFRYSL